MNATNSSFKLLRYTVTGGVNKENMKYASIIETGTKIFMKCLLSGYSFVVKEPEFLIKKINTYYFC